MGLQFEETGTSQITDSEYLLGLSLSDSQKEGILGENARELIGL